MELKLILIFVTIALTIGLSIWLARRYHLDRYQMMLFALMVLFWSSVNIIRAYRKSYAMQPLDIGGLELGAAVAANIAAAYGLISVFMRFPTFFISDFFKSRKLMFIGSALLLSLTSLWVLKAPNMNSLYYSSMAMGLGASMLSLFNVTFSETFSEKQAMMSVSILSVAPLLAEFLMSPFQFITTSETIKNYPQMWMISLMLSVATILFLFFVKDNKQPQRTMTLASFRRVAGRRSIWILGLVGILVSFARFGLTGSNFVTYAQSDAIGMSPFLVAYVELMYSIAQLIAGVLAGLWFARRIGAKYTLLLGLGMSILFNLLLLTVQEPTVLFFANALSGFGYGLTYNALIGLALQPYDRKDREMSMGIFQTLFGIGIFFGDKIYALMKNSLPKGTEQFLVDQNVFRIVLGISVITFVAYWILAPRDQAE